MDADPAVVIHVAVADNGVIGRDGDLPWRLATDMARFKASTMGKPVVMGRKTWESFPRRPLPGRANIVISRDRHYEAEGAEVVASLDEALALAKEKARGQAGVHELCILGGGQIYAQALPLADRLYVTHVSASPQGDTRFPEIDASTWEATSSEEVPAGEKDSHPTRFVIYRRRVPR